MQYLPYNAIPQSLPFKTTKTAIQYTIFQLISLQQSIPQGTQNSQRQ